MSRLANKQCEAYVSLCLALSPYDRQVYSGLLDVSVIAGKEVCIRNANSYCKMRVLISGSLNDFSCN